MEMINKAAYEDRKETGMEDAQAIAIASHIPDWSQFTTKQDLEKGMSRLEVRMVFWMFGLLFAAGLIDWLLL